MRVVGALTAAALAVSLGACQGSSATRPSATGPSTTTGSPTSSTTGSPTPSAPVPRVRTRVVTVHASDGTDLAATAYGSGTRGVALFHESDSSQAVWRDYAPRLAAKGLLVLAIDARGHGGSRVVGKGSGAAGYGVDGAAAVAWLRSHGARRVALVGASIGGTMALATAERTGIGAAGVVSLSGPATDHGQLDAIGGATRAPRRVLLVVGATDRDFVGDARSLAGAMPRARLVVADTGAHGTALLGEPAPGGGTVADLVTSFVLDAVR